ncbi:MAG: serine--tRNA ligase, partial [Deltaproteobacteria bacterium]|nr:serine--tRNA ligase [Deltaproteobacteria bacterium]
MLEIKFVSQNLSIVQKALAARGYHVELDTFKKSDDKRRLILQEIESLRHQRNVVSDRVAEMKKAGDNSETLVVEMRAVSSKIKDLEKKLAANQAEIHNILLGLPNIAHATVPIGADESDNP